jgi:hypothetical protein
MLSPKDLHLDHPLVQRALQHIREHNGYMLTTADVSKAVGVPVGHEQTRCAIGAAILRILIAANLVYMREASHGQRRFWVVEF